jgi:hypothetical protein
LPIDLRTQTDFNFAHILRISNYFRHGLNRIKNAMPIVSKTTKLIAALILIATISLLAFSVLYSWSGLIPLLASLGGEIVFLGLWIENEADDEAKKEEHLPAGLRLKAKWGWWILMVGILLEIVTGAGLAAFDVYENAQMDPLNHPIATGSATVSLVLSGETNLETVGRSSIAGQSSTNRILAISFCRLDQVTTGLNLNSHVLLCSRWEHPQLNFWSFKFDSGTATYFAGDTWVRDVKKWNVTKLYIPFLHSGTEIVGGRLVLTVNATTWNIEIPKQRVGSLENFSQFLKHPFPTICVVGE